MNILKSERFRELFLNLGWRAVSVPGEIHGYWTEFTNFGSGKVSWAQLVQPTIDILVKGCLTLIPIPSYHLTLLRSTSIKFIG